MRQLSRYFAAALPVLLLACSGPASVVQPVPATGGQQSFLPNVRPAEAYALVARQVRACWFNPADPVLTKHEFRAEAGAGGASGNETAIIIYERATGNQKGLGLKAYVIRFEKRGKGTAVRAQNQRIHPVLAQKLSADIGYWIQGGQGCEGPPPSPATPPRGSFAVPGAQLPPPTR